MNRDIAFGEESREREELLMELAALRHAVSEMDQMKKESLRMDKIMRMAIAVAQEEKAKTEAIISALSDGITIQDTEFRILYQNECHKGLFGEHIGKHCYQAYRSRDTICDDCHVALTLADGGVHRSERMRVTDKGRRYFEVISSPLRNPAGAIVAGIETVRDITDRKLVEEERERLITRLRDTLANVKTLRGLLPMCSCCKKIRDDRGYWQQVEEYIRRRSEAEFSHSICPECIEKLYPEYYKRRK